jgi:hypothetical protein
MKANISGFKLRSVLLLLIIGLPLWGCTSTPKPAPADDPGLRALEPSRAQLRAEKRKLVDQAMMLDPSQRTAFWAEYDKYEGELKNYHDQKYLLIRDYARNYKHMSDDLAASLAQRVFNLQQTRLDLGRKYFSAFSKATSPTIAARFLQLENQINLLSDIRIGSEIPMIPLPAENTAK